MAILDKVDWTRYIILALIENYEMHPCLYDHNHKSYTNKKVKSDAMQKITRELKKIDGRIEVEDVKKKLIHLRQQFSHENLKIQRSSIGTEENTYEPTVWWYEKLVFLTPHTRQRKRKRSPDSPSFSEAQFNETQFSETPSSDNELDLQDEDFPIKSEFLQNSNSEATPSCLSHKTQKYNETDDTSDLKLDKLTTSGKSSAELFGDYVALELSTIRDEEILNEAKHQINNVLYEAKKKWFAAQKKHVNPDA